MGCCAARNRVEENPQDRYSIPSVVNQKQTPAHHHGINSLACGYVFNVDRQQLGQMEARQKANKNKQEQNDLFSQFQAGYLKLQQRFREHDIDSCKPLLEQIIPLYQKLNFKVLEISQTDQEEMEKLMDNASWLHSEMVKFAGYIEQEGWEDQGVKNNIHTYTKRDGNSVAALVETQIDIPVEIFLTIMGDMDLLGEMNPDVKECREDKQIDRNHKIGYCLYDIPILALREVAYEGVGYNRLNHNGTILLYSQSIHNNPDICRRWDYTPRMNKNYVQIDYKYIITEYTPISVGKGKLKVVLNNDLKLNFLPMRLLQMVTKMISNDLIKTMVGVSKKYQGSKWEAKVKRHPETFNFFKEIINQYYEQHNMI